MRPRILTATICSTLFLLACATAGIAAAPPTPGAPELTVDITRMQYQCQMRGYDYTIAPGITNSLKGYRSFEIDAYITNRSGKPVEIILKPTRWIITDGTKDVISDLGWEWGKVPATEYRIEDGQRVAIAIEKPQIVQWKEQGKTVALQPGQTVAQTFIAFPLGKGEWVKGVDFVFNGQTYHKDFDIGPYGTDHNYGQDCGIWAPGPDIAPTPTPGPAALAIKLPTPQPAKAVAVARTSVPKAAAQPLQVDITRRQYQCQMRGYDYTVAPGVTNSLTGYRSFEIDAYITNHSNKPVEIVLRPTRWIITDGKKNVISDLGWEWGKVPAGFKFQMVRGTLQRVPVENQQIVQWQEQGKTVTLQPSQSVGWTFVAFPLDKGEWVKGVDFVFGGQTYHKDFDLGPFGIADNYGQDCGVWAPGADRKPTPTPGPAAAALGVPAAPRAPATPAQRAAAPARPLEVQFINQHYECVNGTLEYEATPGITNQLWGYRYFQTDMYVTNHSAQTVQTPWIPRRWIITDGTHDVVNDLIWTWGGPNRDKIKVFDQSWAGQPAIPPGQQAGWTFIAFPLEPNQWVKGVDFDWNGQTYHQDFTIGPYHNEFGYDKGVQECGVPQPDAKPHNATPTPRP